MSGPQVRLLDGSTFMVSDGAGDVGTSLAGAGLFYRDVRHLSHWQLRVDGLRLTALTGQALEYDDAMFYLVEYPASVRETAPLTVVRRRHLGRAMTAPAGRRVPADADPATRAVGAGRGAGLTPTGPPGW